MQNGAVAKPPEPPKPADRKPAVAHDFSLDPLPVPDATESNTDTVWGLWEHTLQAQDDSVLPTESGELQDFPDTEYVDLTPTTPPPKKP
ncbi:hypothetical protein DIC66_16205 [Rhodoferax lacus]|uniref:Uncharacterized protein n=1 Tax=Rhodoferax lacus TaxID=2184758 RepID=A0A3E1R9F2_9BURK|nr:hypothetical protein DIC66_16205 [Rhodoferax lacus]